MTSPQTHRQQTVITALAALVGLAGVLNVALAAEGEESSDSLIQHVIAHTTRPALTLRAVRHLEAGTRSGDHRGWMDVETTVHPSGAFAWRVITEGGSERTREKVFRALLEAETQAWQSADRDGGSVSPANYIFTPEGMTPDGQVRIRLTPRRADKRLVNGTLAVSPNGQPLLLEGRLAKSPSFWVKSVTIVKRYARIGGVSVPVSIESLADVKIFGQSTFSMRYRYTEINGRSVAHTIAAAPGFGPSHEILALHATVRDEQ